MAEPHRTPDISSSSTSWMHRTSDRFGTTGYPSPNCNRNSATYYDHCRRAVDGPAAMPENPHRPVMTHPTANSTPDLRRTAWLVVALLVPVALLNYLDRQMLAQMKSSMMGDITDIATDANWGIVLAAFKWVYALLSPVGGYIADRVSRRHVIAGSLFVWSAVTWGTGQVESFPQLVAARAIMGISEAFYMPAALALIADYHFGPTRSRAVGIHQMGIYAGNILGGFAGYVAQAPSFGWRWAFSACGIVGVVYSLPLFLLVRNPSLTEAP